MNQYLDMLSAHVSYWTSKTFATFVLTQLLTDFESDEGRRAPTIVPALHEDRESKEASTYNSQTPSEHDVRRTEG